MNKAILNRNLRKLHLWFGIAIGLQLGLWLISGLFMTIFPIDHVRGTHLRAETTPTYLSRDTDVLEPIEIISKHDLLPKSITLQFIDKDPVYVAVTNETSHIFDAKTGQTRPPLNENLATKIAVENYAGRSTQTTASFFSSDAPRAHTWSLARRLVLGRKLSRLFFECRSRNMGDGPKRAWR